MPTIELCWRASALASGLYAVERLLAGRAPLDPRLCEALSDVAGQWGRLPAVLPEMAPRLLEQLVALAAGIANPAELARVALTKTRGRRDDSSGEAALARWLRAVASSHAAARPRAVEELELRSGPLRQQWEARGPGLMAAWSQRVGAELLAPRADVTLVEPVCGGGGAAHLDYNAVTFEAVLANPHEELSEVARLGWLLAQLNLEIPLFAGDLPRAEVARLAPLAVLPALVDAATFVELARPDPGLLARAAEVWLGASLDAAALTAWWETRCATRSPWPVALAALRQMVSWKGGMRK